MEAAIRNHDYSLISILEESHGGGPVVQPIQESDRQHRRALDVLEPLGHADGFALEPCSIQLDGGRALASCEVKGTPEAPPAYFVPRVLPPLPKAIDLEYRRTATGWALWSVEARGGEAP